MIPTLKPYSEMKDSSVRWLGKLPSHWIVRRLKSVTSIKNGATPSTNNDAYWNGDILWITPEDLGALNGREIRSSKRKVSAEGYEACGTSMAPANSIAISTRAPIGHLAILGTQGCTNQGCKLLVPKEVIQSEFLFEILGIARPELQAWGDGTTFLELSRQKLGDFRVAIPPVHEQSYIARFLDHIDRRFQRYIRTKQKLIALLEEQKKTIIQKAVTGQIDVRTGKPYGTYKHARLVGLGEIPMHWEPCRLRNVVSVVTTGSRGWSSYAADTGPLFIRVANLSRGSIQLRFDDTVRLNLPNTTEAARSRIRGGDLLVSVTAYIGSVGVVPEGLEEAYVSQHVARCQPLPGQSGRWLAYGLLSELGQSHGQLSLYGGTKDGLSLDDVKNFPILLPPRREQEQIVRWIDGKLALLTKVKDSTLREIAGMREYEARFVSDVVTGKLDVRQAATTLPVTQVSDDAHAAHREDERCPRIQLNAASNASSAAL